MLRSEVDAFLLNIRRHSSYAIAFTRYAIWHACILFWGSAPFAPSPNS
jgi:hypothetical protein